MTDLIALLKIETETLKIQYIEMTEAWAKEQVIRNRKRAFDYGNNAITDYPSKKDYYAEQKWYHGAPSWHFNTAEFVKRSIEAAKEHYENSIVKFASRIVKKKLDTKKIKVKTAHVGVNINTVLTDGNITVCAWTIIASGKIQRPHYRYLIK
jgi:hypothetical protein